VRLRKLLAAALTISVAAVPVGIALADEPDAPLSLVSTNLRPTLAGQASAAGLLHGAVRARLGREHLRLARRYDDLTGRRTAGAAAARARTLPPARLRAGNRELRSDVNELDVPIPPELHQIAECESHGDPKAVGGGGQYRGLLQFSQGTWEGAGGDGDPVHAPAEEQLRRGAILMARSGSSPWPVCGA
jgi:Transglycosylase-like domain